MRRALGIAALVLFAIVLVRTAWICDDAFITFRVIDNLLHGYGLRWNVAERVQVYTHPLWMMALIPVVAAMGPYYGSMALGAAISLSVVAWFLWRGAADGRMAAVAFAALLGSQAFVDFSTSGLENPLAHALLLATAVRFAALRPQSPWRDRATVLVLASLAGVDRLDHLVLVAPLALATWLGAREERARILAIGCLPLLAWEAFAVVYYGFPFPNTAYAKLATGIPAIALARQGLRYLATCALWDPLTVAVIAAGVVAAAVDREPGDLAIAAGILLWFAYLVRVGGDHMAGRFLTPAFALALWLVVRKRRPFAPVFAAAAVGLAALAHHPPIATGAALLDNHLGPGLISDERAYFYRISGLLRRSIDPPLRRMPGCYEGDDERKKGPHVVAREMIGWFSYFAGPAVHVVDPLGLGDALLARIPASADYYRAGHYKRSIPEGYLEAAQVGGGLRDRDIDEYWSEIRVVTRGPLFSLERLRDVVDLDRPGVDARVAAWCERSCSVWHEADAVSLDAPLWLPPLGWAIHPDPPRAIRRVLLDAEPGSYVIRVLGGGHVAQELPVDVDADGEPAVVSFPAVRADQVRILPATPGSDLHVRGVLLAPKP